MAFSPRGQLASASHDHTARLWDATSHSLLATLSGHTGWVEALAYSPDGGLLATASTDRTVRLWDTVSYQLLAKLTGHSGVVKGVAFSPDGRHVASASDDQTVRVWNARTEARVICELRLDAPLTAVAWGQAGIAGAHGDELVLLRFVERDPRRANPDTSA